MFKKKKNYKLLIGFMVGLIISATGVYAATYYGAATDLSYDNTSSGLTSTNVQDALDELYEMKNDPCPDGYYCEKYKTTLELGDYVSYTPTKTSATTNTAYTGYSSTQTINPSELNLWRVLNINDDGTVDLISEYISSTDVYFRGQTGYLNLVGELNRLASQYETEGITSGSRYFGYNGQTEYITDTSKFTTTPPWTASTSDNSNESVGGGDILYEKDYNQASTVLGTLVALKTNNNTISSYWVASRYYYYSSSSDYRWYGRLISTRGALYYDYLYYYDSSSFYDYYSRSDALRPIVTLKSGLSYYGLGTEYGPMEIIS